MAAINKTVFLVCVLCRSLGIVLLQEKTYHDDIYLETIIVFDKAMVDNYADGDPNLAISKILELFRVANQIFAPVNVFLVIQQIYYETKDKVLHVPGPFKDWDTLAEKFEKYYNKTFEYKSHPRDALLMLTGEEVHKTIHGECKPIGSVNDEAFGCDISGCVVRAMRRKYDENTRRMITVRVPFMSLAVVIAHELAHILHVGDEALTECKGKCSGCVMGSVNHTHPNTIWGPCSRHEISRWASPCARKLPTFESAYPLCGNKIQENDETCEIGKNGKWPDCCDRVTCKIIPAGHPCDGEGNANESCDLGGTCDDELKCVPSWRSEEFPCSKKRSRMNGHCKKGKCV